MPIPFLTAALIGAGTGAATGAAKHFFIDKPAKDKVERTNKVRIAFSPFTGKEARPVPKANPFSSILGGAVGGLGFTQALNKAGAFANPFGSIDEELTKQVNENFVPPGFGLA